MGVNDMEYQDLITLIEKKVQELAKENWKLDKCPPEFWVSLCNEDMNHQQIMITINHNYKFTQKLFPRDNTEYGYESLLDQMRYMYNQTL